MLAISWFVYSPTILNVCINFAFWWDEGVSLCKEYQRAFIELSL